MSQKVIFIRISLVIAIFIGSCTQQSGFPILSGPYLGQKPPGDVPELFAPGIVSTQFHEHSFPTFSPDGKEVHWSVFVHLSGQTGESANFFGLYILSMKQIDGVWHAPEFSSFTTPYQELEGFITPNGNQYFFASRRPLTIGGEACDGNNIWKSEKQGDRWKDPVPLPPPVRTYNPESSPTVARNGTLYYEGVWEGGEYRCGIYRSEFINGAYSKPELLPESINTSHFDCMPFISADEHYLLFSSNRPGGYGRTDLYISCRNEDGTWTESFNLGQSINSEYEEKYPYVSPDGKYLFFVVNKFLHTDALEEDYSYARLLDIFKKPGNGANDIYWVVASFIENLRKEVLGQKLEQPKQNEKSKMKKLILFVNLLIIVVNINVQGALKAIRNEGLQTVKELVEKNPQLANERMDIGYTNIR